MKFVFALAIGAALVAGASIGTAAHAQKKGQAAAAAPAAAPAAERKYDISKEAAKPLQALRNAVVAKDHAAFLAALPAAEAAVKTTDDRYLLGKFRLQHALDTGDKASQRAAVEAILATGGATAEETTTFQVYLGTAYAEAGDFVRSESALGAVVAANPNKLDAVVNLARAKIELKKEAEALDLLQRAIKLSTDAGEKAPEGWYRNAMALAYRQKNTALATQINNELVRLYPSKDNFKNAIALYRSRANLSGDSELDLLRLLFASGGMSNANEYLSLARYLQDAGLPGEVKTVIESGVRSGVLKPASAQQVLATATTRIAEDRASLPGVEAKARKAATGSLALSTGHAYAGYGDYNKAVELYSLALQKGGVDANLVNTRLGIAYALSGRRVEAEAAFKAVTGARAELAGLWMTWLAQRG
jgi:tetratricopeptide (TPR) repeat protein